MLRKAIYLFLLLSLGLTLLVGFKQEQPSTAPSNMIIVIEGHGGIKNMQVHISESGGKYEKRPFKGKHTFDYSAVLELVGKYQQEGWQIKESSFSKNTVEDSGSNPDDFPVLYFRLAK